MDGLFKLIDNAIGDFSVRKILVLFSLLGFAYLVFQLYELETSSFELSRYEKSISILKEANRLASSNDSNVKSAAESIIKKVQQVAERKSILKALEEKISPKIAQIIFAMLPWIVLSLLIVPLITNSKKKILFAIIFFIIVGLFIGAIAFLIPVTFNNWYRYGGPMLLNIAIFFMLSHKGKKKRLTNN